jgi:hypothetical protein
MILECGVRRTRQLLTEDVLLYRRWMVVSRLYQKSRNEGLLTEHTSLARRTPLGSP